MGKTESRGQGVPAASCRIALFDELRGFTTISMVVFHASYDLAYLYGVEMPWFTQGPFQDIWRATISWTFLALAGWMTSFSRNNVKRAAVYGLCALAVFAATTIAAVDTPVNFGILACMAGSTALYAIASPVLRRIPPSVGAVSCLLLFFLTLGVPRATYPVEGLAWLGFPSPAFASGDYYPLIPFAFMYLAGSFGARLFKAVRGSSAYPLWARTVHMPVFDWIGRRSLVIYLLHQPVIIAVLSIVFS